MAVVRRRQSRNDSVTVAIRVKRNLPSVEGIEAEIDHMRDVLLGQKEAPIDNGVSTLMEIADAYYARCADITMHIMRLERQNKVPRGSPLYRLRTGELRLMMELTTRLANLGSRRITAAELRFKKVTYGRESAR